MNVLISLISLFAFLAAGMLLSVFRPVRESRILAGLSTWALFALLFFMGFRISSGTDPGKLAGIGLMSLVSSVSSVAGTAAVLFLFYSVFRHMNGREESSASGEAVRSRSSEDLSHLKEPLKLFLIVCAGFAAGWFTDIPGFTGEKVSTWMLRFLLFSIGIDLIRSGISIKSVLASPETVFLPAGVIAGSVLGSLIPSAVFGLSFGQSAAVASGFGWYSLSGVLIADMGDPLLGSAAFIANILRETISLLTIPVISRTAYPHIGIGIAGATSMDVTLPLIEKCCGTESVPLSITSGAFLSLLVPFLVPLFYQM